jgi:hypothetical protein
MKMQKLFPLLFGAIMMVSACGPTPTVIPGTVSNDPTQSVVATAEQGSSATPAPVTSGNTLIVEASPTVEITTGNLPLQVTSPQDGDTLTTAQVDVIGIALAGSVVSVNDDILVVGDDQQFKSTISLDEGPNLIEVVASDDNGNETSVILTVTYEP